MNICKYNHIGLVSGVLLDRSIIFHFKTFPCKYSSSLTILSPQLIVPCSKVYMSYVPVRGLGRCKGGANTNDLKIG